MSNISDKKVKQLKLEPYDFIVIENSLDIALSGFKAELESIKAPGSQRDIDIVSKIVSDLKVVSYKISSFLDEMSDDEILLSKNSKEENEDEWQ
jgi:hypothetical protein